MDGTLEQMSLRKLSLLSMLIDAGSASSFGSTVPVIVPLHQHRIPYSNPRMRS